MIRGLPERIAEWLRRHGEHLVFGVAVGTLLLLGTWWLTYLGESVDLEREHALLQLQLATRDEAERLVAGQEATDDRLGVVRLAGASPYAAPLRGRSGDAVDVDPAILVAVEATHMRRHWMVWGEGGLLLLLIGACIAMLWRLVSARNALEREMLAFTGQMTHEMKTPLVGLRALLETMQKGRIAPEDLPDLVELGLEQVAREERLVKTLLQAQRLRLTERNLRREPIDLAEVARRFTQHRAAAAPGTLSCAVEGAAVAVGDPDAVWTILENLCDNAQKQGARRVVLRLREDARAAWLECADDGRGFDPARAAALFQPFRSAHDDGAAVGGSGLGLHICRRLARGMRGELVGESEGPDRGATFRLALPRPTA